MKKSQRKIGIAAGLMSGFAYGIYTTLVMVASWQQPLAAYAGLWVCSYVCAGLNDLFAGGWLGIYHIFKDRGAGIVRTLASPYGRRVLLGALFGGPVANGLYLTGLSLAGVYAVLISAMCGLFGTCLDWLIYKHKPDRKVFVGMLFCIAGAALISWSSGENGTVLGKGILFAVLAAFFWGLEGMLSGSKGQDADAGSAANIRELFSGLVNLFVMVPLLGGIPLLKETLSVGSPVIWLACSGLAAAISYLCWYRSNSLIGCAAGMSLNVTYVFWSVLFCVIFFGQSVSGYMALGSVLIVTGSVLVAK